MSGPTYHLPPDRSVPSTAIRGDSFNGGRTELGARVPVSAAWRLARNRVFRGMQRVRSAPERGRPVGGPGCRRSAARARGRATTGVRPDRRTGVGGERDCRRHRQRGAHHATDLILLPTDQRGAPMCSSVPSCNVTSAQRSFAFNQLHQWVSGTSAMVRSPGAASWAALSALRTIEQVAISPSTPPSMLERISGSPWMVTVSRGAG